MKNKILLFFLTIGVYQIDASDKITLFNLPIDQTKEELTRNSLEAIQELNENSNKTLHENEGPRSPFNQLAQENADIKRACIIKTIFPCDIPGAIIPASLLNEFFNSQQRYEGYCVLFSALEEKINLGSFSQECIRHLEFYPVRSDCISLIDLMKKLNSINHVSRITSGDVHKICFLRENNLLKSHRCKKFKNKIEQFDEIYKINARLNLYIQYLNELSAKDEFTTENFLNHYF